MRPSFDTTRYLGSFRWIVGESLFVLGGDIAAAFGIAPLDARQGIDLAALVDAVHPDDRAAVHASTERASYYGGDLDIEFRLLGAGEFELIKLTGCCMRADSGLPAEYLGALHISIGEEPPLGTIAAHLCAAAELAHRLDEPSVQRFLDMALFELGTRLAALERELEKPRRDQAVIR
ncbi:MAG: hypothetical protein WC807_20985 [Hyphomicrobium sp.]|jgi:hypothetical protein